MLVRLSPALGVVLLCTGLVFVASWVGLLDVLRIDTWTERQFVKYADAYIHADINPDVVLITAVDAPAGNGSLGQPDASWRRYHADLINALSQEGVRAKVIAFDLFLEDTSDADNDLSAAIKKATESGTTVVLGVRKFAADQGVANPLPREGVTKTLEERNWGFLEVGGAVQGTAAVRKLRLAMELNTGLPPWAEAPEPAIVPSFTLQVLRAALSPRSAPAVYGKEDGQLKLRDENGRVVQSIPVDEGINYVLNERETAAWEKINYRYHEVYKNLKNVGYLQSYFDKKIVLIGYQSANDLPGLKDGDNAYGVQIQAGALSDLLQNVHISKLKTASSLLAIALMSLVGLLLGTRYRHVLRPSIPVQLSVVTFHVGFPLLLLAATAAYLLIAISLYKYNRILLGIPYHVAVLFLTFGLADQIESRKVRRLK